MKLLRTIGKGAGWTVGYFSVVGSVLLEYAVTSEAANAFREGWSEGVEAGTYYAEHQLKGSTTDKDDVGFAMEVG